MPVTLDQPNAAARGFFVGPVPRARGTSLKLSGFWGKYTKARTLYEGLSKIQTVRAPSSITPPMRTASSRRPSIGTMYGGSVKISATCSLPRSLS
jgi:hypothetical protein